MAVRGPKSYKFPPQGERVVARLAERKNAVVIAAFFLYVFPVAQDCALKIEHDPCWGMVARVFLPTRPSVNTDVHEPDRQIR
jgi:hypothetical protein